MRNKYSAKKGGNARLFVGARGGKDHRRRRVIEKELNFGVKRPGKEERRQKSVRSEFTAETDKARVDPPFGNVGVIPGEKGKSPRKAKGIG